MTAAFYCTLSMKIYGLFEFEEIRYVGKASDMGVRLKHHLQNASSGRTGHVYDWIRKLKRLGMIPEQRVIAAVSDGISWQTLEKYCIQHFKEAGADLTNSTAGGEGLCNPSKETRQKMSKAWHCRTDGVNERLRVFNRDRVFSEEHRKNLGEARRGKVQSTETRLKISRANAGRKLTPEQLQRLSTSHIGLKPTDEARKNMSEAAKRWRKNER